MILRAFPLLLACAVLLQAQAPDISGRWLGSLSAGGATLRLVFHFDKPATGAWTGKLDSIDQGANGIPLGKIEIEGAKLTVEIPAVRGSYTGTLAADGKEIQGQWSQGGASFPLNIRKTDASTPILNRPQEPKKPYPYEEVEVSYPNAAHGVNLAGTLTFPKGARSLPAVVLITGSGPQNRNEELMGHKPFLVLADHLTRKGLVVLRVDDRGIGGSSGNFARATSHDFAADVEAGIEFLKTRAEVDPKRIGLAGHSEGGLIAPIVAAKSRAAQSTDVAFIVLMAGTGVTGEQILYEQAAAIIRANGGSADGIEANRATQAKAFALMREEKDPDELRKKMEALLLEAAQKLPEAQRNQATAQAKAQASQFSGPWFRTFVTLDPVAYLSKVACPVLAVNGELDLQVLPDQNLPMIEKALKAGGNQNYTIKRFPGLNHLFQTAKTGAPAEYGSIEETIAPAVLDTISGWILNQTTKR